MLVFFVFFFFCSSQNERLPAEMYVWFSCKAIKLLTKTKLEFFNQIHSYYLATPHQGGTPL